MQKTVQEKETLDRQIGELIAQQSVANKEINGLNRTVEQLREIIEEKDVKYGEIKRILENMTEGHPFYVPQNVNDISIDKS